jgi:hypothetical protein
MSACRCGTRACGEQRHLNNLDSKTQFCGRSIVVENKKQQLGTMLFAFYMLIVFHMLI